MASRQFSSPSTPSRPREFPSSGFEVIDPSQKVEEERLPFYKLEDYYPMQIGQVLENRYHVVAKLGYGISSTVWLSRDLMYELNVYRRLSGLTMDHPGRGYVRQFHDSFELKGPHGEHEVFVMTPLGMSLRTLQELQKDHVFQQSLATTALSQALLGLSYLHEADVIHTDLHSDNLLVAITDDGILSTVEENEIQKPSARKVIDDAIIYVSQYMLGGAGPLTICDLGQARIGRVHRGNAMPMVYRAPEVILGMTWGNAVDVWSTGLLAWDLLEKESLFRVYDRDSQEQNDAHHVAALTALLGPPPPEFLKRSEKTGKYWNEDGQWHGPVPLPPEKKLEALIHNVAGEDKEVFINFLECVLTWLPEDRLTSLEAYFHPWVRGEKVSQGED
ncbi:hypothetical protein MRS44_004518 [Fusarium solani]|uniref:uncharacterized protein n=1 Tax=Fusarium solani TaxID=169388 RepID=UPI0032C46DF2|nr:hypothetical protein MRS44_004518 [Fusarium solani]